MLKYCGKSHKKLLKTIIILMVVICMCFGTGHAVENDPNTLTPSDEQYFELKAVEIKDVDGQEKQVIMELWGHNLEFKRI